MSTCLQKPVERNPEEENISEELNESKNAVNNPIRQPLCIVVFFFGFYGLYAGNKNWRETIEIYFETCLFDERRLMELIWIQDHF